MIELWLQGELRTWLPYWPEACPFHPPGLNPNTLVLSVTPAADTLWQPYPVIRLLHKVRLGHTGSIQHSHETTWPPGGILAWPGQELQETSASVDPWFKNPVGDSPHICLPHTSLSSDTGAVGCFKTHHAGEPTPQLAHQAQAPGGKAHSGFPIATHSRWTISFSSAWLRCNSDLSSAWPDLISAWLRCNSDLSSAWLRCNSDLSSA